MANNPYLADFPILARKVNGHQLCYLDNAATSQKPQVVIDRINHYYTDENANIHRGTHTLAQQATQAYEAVRDHVQHFLNAASREEIVFTRSTTEGLNWLARQWGLSHLQAGDEIVISLLEHHSNLVPWQQVAKKTGAHLRYLAANQQGLIDLAAAEGIINARTKIVSIAQVSNVLGSRQPIKQLTALAHKHGAVMIVDAAQSAPHMAIDVQDLDCDFMAFSAHKMLGPTGVGVLYGKQALLDDMSPEFYGGEMVEEVTEQSATFKQGALRFEAGTQNIAGVIAFGSALSYLQQVGFERIENQDRQLVSYAWPRLQKLNGVQLYGSNDPSDHNGIISFTLDGLHPHDVATIFDDEGIAIRAGQHCAQPLLHYLSLSATCRASFYFYNTIDDVDRLLAAIVDTQHFFNRHLSRESLI